MPRSAKICGVKSLRCYTIQEAAVVTGVSDRTIRAWIKQGLAAMTDDRPTLVRGDVLIRFIQNQRQSRKTILSPNELYCLKCRAARQPAGGLVDCEAHDTRAKLTAICDTCGTIMHKPVALERAATFSAAFDVTSGTRRRSRLRSAHKQTPILYIKEADRCPLNLPLRACRYWHGFWHAKLEQEEALMTTKLNEKNERTKRAFMTYRKHAKQVSDKTMDREIAHLERFDVWNKRKDFAKFHIDWAVGFREHLDNAKGATGKPLAKSTTRSIMATMREFTLWLSQQEGFRRRIKAADSSYFQLSRRDEAEARAAPQRPAPSIRQAKRALSMMPSETPRQIRDKAIFALLCLTGIRVEALTSLKIKHVDLDEKSVTQNPREVATKFGKRIDTFFSKDFAEAEIPLRAWITYLDEVALYGPDDPLFPATALTVNASAGFKPCGFTRSHWKTTEPVRKMVNTALETAGLPAYGPHAFRHMLARHAAKNSNSVAEFIANAQNLGHTDPLTTLRSYGQISRDDQRRLITGEEL